MPAATTAAAADAAAARLLLRGSVLREELIEGFAATDDRTTQRDGVRLACERPGAGFAGLLIPDPAMPVGIVLAVLEQGAIRFEPLPARLTAAAAVAAADTGTFAWTAAAIR